MDSLRGVIVPLITPLTKEEDIDLPSLKKLLKHVTDGGVNGIFVLSTSGETVRLYDDQKDKILETVMEECQGKVDVYVGIMGSGLKKVLVNLEKAIAFGAKAAVLCPPYCYHVCEEEMARFFLEVSENSTIPLILYNIPSLVGDSVGNRVYEDLKDRRNIVGVKDSSGDISYLRELISSHASNDFKVFVGSEEIMLEGMKMGASGMVPSLANVFPKLFVNFYNAFVNNDLQQAEILFNIIKEFHALHNQPYGALNPIAVRKQALAMLGIVQPWMTEPVIIGDTDYKSGIKEYLLRYEDCLGL